MIQNDMTYLLLKKAIDGTQLRQEAIASNLSNLNTKGFKANKVNFEVELKKVLEGNKAAGELDEMKKNISAVEPKVRKDYSGSMNNDGNNVDLDLEMSQLAANQILYQSLIQQINQKYRMASYVIHEGRR